LSGKEIKLKEFAQTSFRLPAELVDRLKWACLKRKTTQVDAVIVGFELWLAKGEAQDASVPLGKSEKQKPQPDSVLTEIEKRNPTIGRALRAAIVAVAAELKIETSDRNPAQDGIGDDIERIAGGVERLTAVANRAGGSSGKDRSRVSRKTAG